MGYPMDYLRVIARNGLHGGYDDESQGLSSVRGDLRRLEHDSRDAQHIRQYSILSGATEEQVKTLFDAFFAGWPQLDTEGWAEFGRRGVLPKTSEHDGYPTGYGEPWPRVADPTTPEEG